MFWILREKLRELNIILLKFVIVRERIKDKQKAFYYQYTIFKQQSKRSRSTEGNSKQITGGETRKSVV